MSLRDLGLFHAPGLRVSPDARPARSTRSWPGRRDEIIPVPPLVPGKELKVGGDKTFSYAVYTALVLLAVVIVPVSLALLHALYGVRIAIPTAGVALTVVAPMVLGLVVRGLSPAFAGRATPILRVIASIMLGVAFVPMAIAAWPAFAPLIGDGTLVVMILVVTIALLGGHLLGAPQLVAGPRHDAVPQ